LKDPIQGHVTEDPYEAHEQCTLSISLRIGQIFNYVFRPLKLLSFFCPLM